MDETAVRQYIVDAFAGVESQDAMGYTFFFYGADRMHPFATLATEDNEYDRVSDLNRSGVFRLNIGVRPETYRSMFGKPPRPPGEDGVVETGHDFSVLDEIMPHPVYAPQSWVCVLSPSAETFEKVKELLAEGYEMAVRRGERMDNGQ